jgi:para-nitrobenzyl esterase
MGCKNKDETIVKTIYGSIQGISKDSVFVWKGIPYAKAPIGNLRWQPPQNPDNWIGIRKADTYGNICPQTGYGPNSIYEIPPQKMSEDCLYLNIWTNNISEEKKPVLVWIHGGSLSREGGTSPQYLGKNLAKKGIVYVSFNYRLNAFGFMAHPNLSAESEDGVSGNYGILDQIKALEWIQKNIAAFGGDSNNVTIAGESAGGWSVTLLVATKKAKGLFQKAIAQSGAYLWPGPHLKDAKNGYSSGEREGTEFMSKLGAKSLRDMRNIPSEDIVNLFFSKNNSLSSEPLIDGYLFKEDIRDTYLKGAHNKVDVITGSNSDEWSLWVPKNLPTNPKEYIDQIAKKYPGREELFLEAYPIKDSASIWNAYANFQSDQYIHLHDRNWAKRMDKSGSRVYMYYFSKTPLERYPKKYGAFHGAEISYALNNIENDPGPIGSGIISNSDKNYADKVSDYWVNFVKTGNPNGENLPDWPLWNPQTENYLNFDNQIEVKNQLLKDRLDALERFLAADPKNN